MDHCVINTAVAVVDKNVGAIHKTIVPHHRLCEAAVTQGDVTPPPSTPGRSTLPPSAQGCSALPLSARHLSVARVRPQHLAAVRMRS